MTLIKWDPFNELSALQNEINKVFHDSLGGYVTPSRVKSGGWAPVVEISETKEDYRVKADLPGVKKEDVDISFSNGTLTIKGERKSEVEEKEVNYYKKELTYGSFKRQLALPENVDYEHISASFDHGVLEVKLPKSQLSKERKITID